MLNNQGLYIHSRILLSYKEKRNFQGNGGGDILSKVTLTQMDKCHMLSNTRSIVSAPQWTAQAREQGDVR